MQNKLNLHQVWLFNKFRFHPVLFAARTKDKRETRAQILSQANHPEHILNTLVSCTGFVARVDLLYRNLKQAGIGEDKAVIVFLNLQNAIKHQVGMYDGIRHGFSNCLMLRCIVIPFYAIHLKRPRKFLCQARKHIGHEVIQVVFPCSIVCEAVTVPLLTHKMRLVNIIQTQIIEPFSYRQTLAEH